MAKVKISRNKFYSEISKLENVGLLRVGEGNTTQPTVLTSVVFNVITILDAATNVYMKLRTIDAVELSGVQKRTTYILAYKLPSMVSIISVGEDVLSLLPLI